MSSVFVSLWSILRISILELLHPTEFRRYKNSSTPAGEGHGPRAGSPKTGDPELNGGVFSSGLDTGFLFPIQRGLGFGRTRPR